MENKREKKQHPITSSSTMPNSVAFSDEIPNFNMNMNINMNMNNNNLTFPFTPALPNIFDTMPPSSHDPKASPFAGYIDLLGIHDYTSSNSLLDWLPNTTTTTTTSVVPASAAETGNQPLPSPASSNVPDGSEVLNSPNSSSISSSSNEAANNIIIEEHHSRKVVHEAEDEDGGRGDDQDQDKTKKQ